MEIRYGGKGTTSFSDIESPPTSVQKKRKEKETDDEVIVRQKKSEWLITAFIDTALTLLICNLSYRIEKLPTKDEDGETEFSDIERYLLCARIYKSYKYARRDDILRVGVPQKNSDRTSNRVWII